MKTEPLVSVVVPTRNRTKKLERCIASVDASSYSNFEIIVVDDASDVDIRTVLGGELGGRLRIIRNESRRYLAGSRNEGALVASGKYVMFVDDDNVLGVNAIGRLVHAMESNRRLAVATPVAFYLEEPSEIWTFSIRQLAPGLLQNTKGSWDGLRTSAFHNAFMVRRDLFFDAGGFDERLRVAFTELDLARRFEKAGFRISVVPDANTWHDMSESGLLSARHPPPEVMYYSFRNRLLIARWYGSVLDKFVSYCVVLPLLLGFYALFILGPKSSNGLASAKALFHGVVDSINEMRPPLAFRTRVGKMAGQPLVSVIIPTRNSARTIDQCLDSIRTQTYTAIETIVVDNNSTDGTIQRVEGRPGVTLLQGGPERSVQLNLAIRHSHGKYVYRVDSDFVVSSRVVGQAAYACEVDGYDAVVVHNTSDPSVSIWAKVRKLERDCYFDDALNVAARFVSRKWLEKVNGFDENLIASEDYDLHNRLLRSGANMGRISAGEVHLGEPKTLREVVAKHVFYGKVLHRFVERYRSFSLIQLGPARPAFVRHSRYFLRDPLATLLFPLYQYVKYSSAIAGYLST